MSPKRPRPRAPFVVTVAFAVAAGACGGSTSVDSGSGAAGGVGGAGGSGGSAGSAALGGSGGGETGGVGGLGSGGCGANPPHVPCPEEPPAEGSPCPQNVGSCFGVWWGTSCKYADTCGGTLIVDCSGTSWTVLDGLTCESCPASAPVDGTPCTVTGGCEYDTCGDGGTVQTASCTNGNWAVVQVPCPVDAGAD